MAGLALACTTPLLMRELVGRWRRGATAARRAVVLRSSVAIVAGHAAAARAVRRWGAVARRRGVHTAAAAGGDSRRLRGAWAAWRRGHARGLALHTAPAVAADAMRLCRALSRWGRAHAARRMRAALALSHGRALVRLMRRAFAHLARAARLEALARGWHAARVGCARTKDGAVSRLWRAAVGATGPGAAGAFLRWRSRARAHGSLSALHSQLGRVVAHATRRTAALGAWRRAAAPAFRARRALLTRAWRRWTKAAAPRCAALRHRHPPARLLVQTRHARSLAACLSRVEGHRARAIWLRLACAAASHLRCLHARRATFGRWRRTVASAHQRVRAADECRWRGISAAMLRWLTAGARRGIHNRARLALRRRALGARFLQWRGVLALRSRLAERAAAASQRTSLRLALRYWCIARYARRRRLALLTAAANFRAQHTRGGPKLPHPPAERRASSCCCATVTAGCGSPGGCGVAVSGWGWARDENVWVQPWAVRGV
jgi:hypothetical protein